MALTPLSADTCPEVEALQFALWRGMTPWEKLRLAAAASRSVAALQRAGITHRSRVDDPVTVQRRIADVRLGPALAARVYGPLAG